MEYAVVDVIDEVKKIQGYDAGGKRPDVMLDANESPYSLPINIIDEIKSRIPYEKLNRYPDPRAYKLCSKISDYVGHGISGDMIIAGDGSDELINIIISSYVGKGRKVLIPTPTFSVYSIYSKVNEGSVIPFNRDKDFNVDIDEMIDCINRERPELVFLCNPNNPTGTLTDREDIIKLLERCKSMIVIDEAYFEFCNITCVDLVKKYKNLIILRTFSKAWGMAGIRLGYLISNKGVIDELLKVKPPYNVNSITQEIGITILDHIEYMKKNTSSILKERDYIIRHLKSIDKIKVYDTYANFIFLKVPDADMLCRALRDLSIGIRNFNNCQGISNHVRVGVGQRHENDQLIEKIKELVGE